MSTVINVVLLVALALAGYYFFRKMKNNKTNKVDGGSPKDPMSQEAYEAKKYPKDEEVSLTMEERVELSWQFLVDITEKILEKFSKDDRDIVHQAGKKMNKHGMNYQHDVGQEAKVTLEIVKSRTRAKKKSASRNR